MNTNNIKKFQHLKIILLLCNKFLFFFHCIIFYFYITRIDLICCIIEYKKHTTLSETQNSFRNDEALVNSASFLFEKKI